MLVPRRAASNQTAMAEQAARAIEEEERATDAAQEVARRLLANVERVVVGKHEQIAVVLSALISGGHVLLEDVPGTAKTMLARSLALSIDGASFARLQCTPDLQPTDVTGLSIFNQKTRETSSLSTRSTAPCRAPSRRSSRRWASGR
jgi:MoxR-like ATPase